MLAPLGTGAAALRAELDQNKVVSGETSIDDAVPAKFRYAGPGGCGRDWKFLLQSMTIRGRKVSPLPTAKYYGVAGGSCTMKGSHPPRSVPGRPPDNAPCARPLNLFLAYICFGVCSEHEHTHATRLKCSFVSDSISPPQ